MATAALFFLSLLFIIAVEATVPASRTFTYVNNGDFGFDYNIEYNALYRAVLSTPPFELCFYTTNQKTYYLALRMGTTSVNYDSRFVWEANRGQPVHDNATLSLHTDGNLVLADADRTVVWSTGTANKGVVGLKLLPNGNMVLLDGRGRFIWQSFDYPTDTLLIGQSLRTRGPAALISRAASGDSSPGIYSLQIMSVGLVLFVNKIGIQGQTLAYHTFDFQLSGTNDSATFVSENTTDGRYQVSLDASGTYEDVSTGGIMVLALPRYNAKFSYLRLQADGNVVVQTFDEGASSNAWEETFNVFSKRSHGDSCELISKCGVLGICEDEMCVACPTRKGMRGWSKSCGMTEPGACGSAVDYSKVVGVENFLTRTVVGEAGVKAEECRKRCDMDCACKGFMYWEEEEKCWLTPLLAALSKVADPGHLAYIKYTVPQVETY